MSTTLLSDKPATPGGVEDVLPSEALEILGMI